MSLTLQYGRSLVILAIVLPAVFLICAGIGAYYVQPWKIPSILLTQESGAYEILLQLRFPRVVLAVLVGAALAVSGVGLQGLFRNPLAAPDLIGVSSGAALGAALWIVIASGYFSFAYGLPISAFCGSVLVVILIFKISKMNGTLGMTSLLLCGIAINSIAGSALGLLTYYSNDEELRTLTFWLMGGLGGASWNTLMFALPFYVVGFTILFTLGRNLNVIALGESEAFCLGVSVERCKIKIVFAVSLLVGVSVSLAGGIGFIGLVTPHLLRLWVGSDHRWLLFSSSLAGAVLLLVADLVSRTIALPAEIPIGIITSLMGGPFFLWLLIRQRRTLLNGV